MLLMLQVYCYQNARCRTEMFDKDIIMIQVWLIALWTLVQVSRSVQSFVCNLELCRIRNYCVVQIFMIKCFYLKILINDTGYFASSHAMGESLKNNRSWPVAMPWVKRGGSLASMTPAVCTSQDVMYTFTTLHDRRIPSCHHQAHLGIKTKFFSSELGVLA